MFDTENQQPNDGSVGGFASVGLFLWDFAKIVIIALAIILPVRYFLFQPFIVSGSSMEPNYSDGQYLIIDEASYHFRDPVRGEVVVLRYPKDHKQFFIKRVIGLPGEKIKIDNGRVTVYNEEHPEGVIMEEPYLSNQGLTFPHITTVVGGRKTIEMGSDEYFVLGDNRLASSDSRDWGVLRHSEIVGRVYVRALPINEFDKFDLPEYSF
jgi:signal peptidase I